MKILVTGGAGFIGSNFVRNHLKHYKEDLVINFDALKYSGNLDNLKEIEGDSNYKFVKGDICDRDDVEAVMRDGIDIVVNFAAQTHVDLALYTSYEFIKTNIVGTKNLLDAASRFEVKKFLQVSTDEVFGDLPVKSKKRFNEKTLSSPRNEYAASKAAAEQFVMAYVNTYSLPAIISNCTNNIGPYQYPEKLVPLAVTNVLEGRKVPIYGNGENIRDWVYVDDHCSALELILSNGKIGERYLIGSNHGEITNLDLIKMILKIMGKPESFIEFVKDRPGHDRKYAVDSGKIKKLGWKPMHPLEESVENTVKWYIDNRWWWERIKSGEYRKNYEMIYGRR